MPDAEERFAQITRNLPAEDTQRIRNGQVTAKERAESPKLDTGCKAWNDVLRETGGSIIYEDGGPMHTVV